MTTTITSAVAVQAEAKTPGHLVTQHSGSFTTVLPSHVRGDSWVRLAQGALKKGKKIRLPNGVVCTELEAAANNNTGVFLASLLEAARLGLEPGTEQYYLTPRKVKGRLEILGIVGYQGYIELMYRAGAISSVIAECVHANDEFVWRPGALDTDQPPRWAGPQERPFHSIDWDAEDRGPLRLVYAYAVMKDRGTSRVCVLNKTDIARIKASSQGANSEYSPWQKHTESMWLKSAVRQLAKWVPTSAEFIRIRSEEPAPIEAPTITVPIDSLMEFDDDQVLDGEIVDEESAA